MLCGNVSRVAVSVKNKNEVETGGVWLVGYRGRLFYVGDDYQVGEYACGFGAVGCGEGYALGALFALHNGGKPKKRIMIALRAAEYFSAGVRGPFRVLSSK